MKSSRKNKGTWMPTWTILLIILGVAAVPSIGVLMLFPRLNPSQPKNRLASEPVKKDSQTVNYDCAVSIPTSGGVVAGNDRFTYLKRARLVTMNVTVLENERYAQKETALFATEANGILTFRSSGDTPTSYRLNLNTLALETKFTISNAVDGTKTLSGYGTCKEVS